MKKIVIKNIKAELDTYDIDSTAKELVLNNVSMYNDLVAEYNSESKHNAYLLYQLNLQIFKSLMELKKNGKTTKSDEDAFMQFKNKFQKKVETR